jgi:hypothetical protein
MISSGLADTVRDLDPAGSGDYLDQLRELKQEAATPA